MSARVGIDLGGTKIEGVVLDAEGREMHRRRVPTRRELGYRSILKTVGELYAGLKGEIGGAPHTLGIGTPGSASLRTGLMRNCNTTCLNGRPLRKDLESLLGRTFELQNDANCFALAEARLGAAKGLRVVFGVILGTGCGGGIVIDGEIWEGRQRIAGEWGHCRLDPSGPPCYCGARGCVETYLSGAGLERRWKEETGQDLSLPGILEARRRGDARAVVFIKDFLMRFGQALACVVNVLDPDAVVLGGGVSALHELYTDGRDELKRHVFSDSLETPVLRNALGDSAGVIGAALLGK